MRPRQPPKTSNVQRKTQTIRIRLPYMTPVLTLHPESQSNAPPNQVARHCFLTAVTRPRRARRRAGLPKLRKRTTAYCHKASAPSFGRQHKSMNRHLPHRAGAAVPLTSPAGRPSYRAETAVAAPDSLRLRKPRPIRTRRYVHSDKRRRPRPDPHRRPIVTEHRP